MLTFASFMEMLMVVCFGISWPINIRKAWKARSTKGIFDREGIDLSNWKEVLEAGKPLDIKGLKDV